MPLIWKGSKGWVDDGPTTPSTIYSGPNEWSPAPAPVVQQPAAQAPAPPRPAAAAPTYTPPARPNPSPVPTPNPGGGGGTPGGGTPGGGGTTPAVPPTPMVEYYGRLVPGQNPIPVITGYGGGAPATPAPVPGGTTPNAPTVPTQGSGRRGWDAQGNYWHNAPSNVVLYPNPPADMLKPAAPQASSSTIGSKTIAAPAPSKTLASQTVNVNGQLKPKYQIDYNYYPTLEEIARYGGMQDWVEARNRGEVKEALQEISYDSGLPGNGVGSMGVGLDQNGNVIMAGEYSGYADDIGQNMFDDPNVVNNWVGSGQLNTDFQETVKANPNMSAAEVDQLSKYQSEIQQAYRMGVVDEQTARAAYTILANDAVAKSQERLAQEQAAAQPQITPPKAGEAGLVPTGGMVQPTGQFADGKPYYGRPVEEIAATGYLDDSERLFFLNSIGKTLDAQGNVVMLGQSSLPSAASSVSHAPIGTPAPVEPAPASGSKASWSDWGELPGGQLAQWAINNGYTRDQIIYQGQSSFPPEVEQWRPLVSQYFAPEDVNHALWIMQHESGGQNIPQHGGGPGTGLFQVEHGGYWPGRPSQQELLDPRVNVAYAAKMVYGANAPPVPVPSY